MPVKITVLAFLCLTLTAFQASAWGLSGHRIEAEVAQRHLSPEAAKAINLIMCGQDLADIANIPDEEFRSETDDADFNPLHFVNISASAKDYESSTKSSRGDLVTASTAITNYLITGDEKDLAYLAARKRIDIKTGLILLVHFIGDMHQPLHIGSATDEGGNKVSVSWMGFLTNLHTVWDREFIQYTQYSYTEYTNYLERKYSKTVSPQVWKDVNYIAWVDQSFALHKKLYTFPDPQKPGQPPNLSFEYIFKNLDTLDYQLWVGGMRLANVLNIIFAG